jgi:hypothetical protein
MQILEAKVRLTQKLLKQSVFCAQNYAKQQRQQEQTKNIVSFRQAIMEVSPTSFQYADKWPWPCAEKHLLFLHSEEEINEGKRVQ